MADALCGPSNALQNFQKHTTVDRTLQQDRLTSRQSPSHVRLPKKYIYTELTVVGISKFSRPQCRPTRCRIQRLRGWPCCPTAASPELPPSSARSRPPVRASTTGTKLGIRLPALEPWSDACSPFTATPLSATDKCSIGMASGFPESVNPAGAGAHATVPWLRRYGYT